MHPHVYVYLMCAHSLAHSLAHLLRTCVCLLTYMLTHLHADSLTCLLACSLAHLLLLTYVYSRTDTGRVGKLKPPKLRGTPSADESKPTGKPTNRASGSSGTGPSLGTNRASGSSGTGPSLGTNRASGSSGTGPSLGSDRARRGGHGGGALPSDRPRSQRSERQVDKQRPSDRQASAMDSRSGRTGAGPSSRPSSQGRAVARSASGSSAQRIGIA